jgi:hypothetical protein
MLVYNQVGYRQKKMTTGHLCGTHKHLCPIAFNGVRATRENEKNLYIKVKQQNLVLQTVEQSGLI